MCCVTIRLLYILSWPKISGSLRWMQGSLMVVFCTTDVGTTSGGKEFRMLDNSKNSGNFIATNI
jgi:hypothetical protein